MRILLLPYQLQPTQTPNHYLLPFAVNGYTILHRNKDYDALCDNENNEIYYLNTPIRETVNFDSEFLSRKKLEVYV